MEEKISPLEIIEYEKEVALYLMNNSNNQETNEFSNISFELKSAVDFIEARAIFYSNIITNILLTLQEEHISYFADLDQRLKKRERIIEKIYQKMNVDQKSMIDAINCIGDSLRYTIVIDDKIYIEKVEEYLSKIEDFGYNVFKFKNAWGNEYYQGINVIFEDSEGFKFEIQFHTPNGFAIKEGKLRNVYNIIRNPQSPSDLVKKCNLIRKYYQGQVRVPFNALEYKYEGKKRSDGK